jgi:hypothetical protein
MIRTVRLCRTNEQSVGFKILFFQFHTFFFFFVSSLFSSFECQTTPPPPLRARVRVLHIVGRGFAFIFQSSWGSFFFFYI